MELPIISKYDETYLNCKNQNHEDRVRLLDIDGAYLVTTMVLEKMTKKFLRFEEIAFASLMEAEEYLESDLGIDLPWKEKEREEWVDYDAD